MCACDNTVFNTCFRFRFIGTCVLVPARYLALILPLVGSISDSPDPACSDSKALDHGGPYCWSEWCNSSI